MTPDDLLAALKTVLIPGMKVDPVTAGLISGVVVHEGKAGFIIESGSLSQQAAENLRAACEKAVKKMGISGGVTIVLTAEKSTLHGVQAAPKPAPAAAKPQASKAAVPPAQWNDAPIEGVARVLAIGSGKGGVGKSTVAVNLALALSQQGNTVGLLDADIYGPSAGLMLGLSGKPAIREGRMVPLEAHGIKALSMAFLVDHDGPVVWRGPMLSKTLQQFARGTDWGALDYLIIDLPPGTGDVQLSLAQQIPIDGAVIVSTPQAVAWLDAKKCALMFEKLGVPVLGIIENMTIWKDAAGKEQAPFGKGVTASAARALKLPVIARLPLEQAVAEGGDSGKPVVSSASGSAAARAIREAAAYLDNL